MFLLNTELGEYKVVSHVADGKDTIIYRAMHERSAFEVAIKVLKPEKADVRSRIKQLVNEASILRGLSHPNIIRFLNLKKFYKPPYLVLEYFPSRNLKQRIVQRDEIVRFRAMRIIMQVCSALDYLHSQGILHKDIKSENILVSNAGEVRLIDFAIAEKIRFRLGRAISRRMTRVQGTRTYIAPEQIRGSQLDARADIYALGVTMYEMITGKPPFTSVEASMVLFHHLRTQPKSMRLTAPEVTEEFDEIVLWTLNKDPDKRPQCASELMAKLGNVKIFSQSPAVGEGI